MSIAYSVNSVTVSSSDGVANFVIQRSGTSADLADSTDVAYATSNVSAIAGEDYSATSGTASFEAGMTSITVPVAILDDADAGTVDKTFLFGLTGYGAATGTIEPAGSSTGVQTYIYVPETDETVTIPTSSSKNANLQYQADTSQFSDPDTSTAQMPLGYFRLGQARADINDYERIVLDADSYVPEWAGTKGDGSPEEIGALAKMMVPRSLDRNEMNRSTGMKDNTHLDGVFLYSNKNYTVTVKENMNTVIKGDSVTYVEGRTAEAYKGPRTVWHYFGDTLKTATGVDKVNGANWQYDISDTKRLAITTDTRMDYTLGTSFSAGANARLEVNNDVKYSVTNGIEQRVSGLSTTIDADILGNFGMKLPGSFSASTGFVDARVSSLAMVLGANPPLAKAARVAVASSAALVASLGMAATSPASMSDFQSGKSFYQRGNGQGLSGGYSKAFSTTTPDTLAAAAAVNAAIVIAASASLITAMNAPSDAFSTIKMSSAGIELSSGASTLNITPTGISLISPSVRASAGYMNLSSFDGQIFITAPNIEATGTTKVLGATTINGETKIVGASTMTGNMSVTGNVGITGFTNFFGGTMGNGNANLVGNLTVTGGIISSGAVKAPNIP